MDVFYEESSIARNATKGARRYRILHILSIVFLVLGFFSLLLILWMPAQGAAWAIPVVLAVWMFLFAFAFYRLKLRLNVSYDYSFVSGELRISKVINVSRRKLVAKIDAEDMIQIGDLNNASFDRLKSDPMTKTVLCTSNDEADKGKFFMYILANHDGKKLFVLECREELLAHILRFVKRSVLESDYIAQEKRQAKV